MNGSGNIEIGISEGSAAPVDANSERGTVRNSVLPRHGDITIHRAGTPR